ncbi:glycosyltransferase family 2 protein, partial [Campylobacter coli]|nr:glycosyltransferase family 2 protein [Campylobacter coli]
MKIGIFPITTYSQLDDFIPRVVWYLYPFRDWFSICNLYVSFKVKKKNKCLEHFDQIIYRNFKHMNISYVSNSNIFDFSFLFGLDYIFLTNDL